MAKTIEELRAEAQKAGLYAIQEAPKHWACIRKSDNSFLARAETSEAMALRAGLVRTKLSQVKV